MYSRVREKLDMQQRKVTVLKIGATILVICCHCCHLDVIRSSYCQYSVLMSRILQNFGSLGVAVFFLLSGYSFGKTSKKTFGSFFQSRCVNLIIPWLFTSTIVYLYTALRKNGINVTSMVLEIIGIGNYTWYLTALFLLYLVFWRIKNDKKAVLMITVICTIVSPFQNLLVRASLLGQCVYIFQFTWVALFGLGLYISQGETLIRWRCSRFAVFIFWGGTTIIVMLLSVGRYQIYYWSYYYPLIAIPFAYGLFAEKVCPKLNIWMDTAVGKFMCNSLLPIYLLHMPIAGIVARIFNYLYYSPIILRPFLTALMTLSLLWIGKVVSDKLHLSKVFCILTGFRGR